MQQQIIEDLSPQIRKQILSHSAHAFLYDVLEKDVVNLIIPSLCDCLSPPFDEPGSLGLFIHVWITCIYAFLTSLEMRYADTSLHIWAGVTFAVHSDFAVQTIP